MARSPVSTARRAPAARRDPDRPSSLRLWLKRRRGLLRPAALWAIGFGLLGATGYAVYAADPAGRVRAVVENAAELGHAAGLLVTEVRVQGIKNAPDEIVYGALGVTLGDPILGFSPAEARERLQTIAWIESAHIERRLPGTILVRLTERQPFAIWQNQGRFAVIDKDGRVVETEVLDAFGPLPLVVGAGAERHAAALYALLQAHATILQRTQAMVRVGERRWNLRLHSGTDVLLPEGHEAPALDRLAELHARNALLDRPLIAVDMRLPDRLVVRQQPVAEQPAAPARRNATRSTRG
jgi:cell division protein FtsQ